VGVSMLTAFLKPHHGDHGRPKFVAYTQVRIRSKPTQVRIRSKPFPGGNGIHTVFHYSHVNPLLTHYEDE
ncbi:hypothetical protein DBR06_SOUSAS6810007, partial [Sousa chinensis]